MQLQVGMLPVVSMHMPCHLQLLVLYILYSLHNSALDESNFDFMSYYSEGARVNGANVTITPCECKELLLVTAGICWSCLR